MQRDNNINLLSLYRNIYHYPPILLPVYVFDQYSVSLPRHPKSAQYAKLAFSITVSKVCLKLSITVILLKLQAEQVCLDQFAKPSTLIILKTLQMNKSARQAENWLPSRKSSLAPDTGDPGTRICPPYPSPSPVSYHPTVFHHHQQHSPPPKHRPDANGRSLLHPH